MNVEKSAAAVEHISNEVTDGAHVPDTDSDGQTSGSERVCGEYADSYDYYEDYEDYPEHPGNAALPEAVIDREVSPYDRCDSELIEGLMGIMSDAVRECGIAEEDYVKAMPYLASGDDGVTMQAEKDRLFAPAVILFGKGWQSKLKRASGYSQGHLQQVYSDDSRAVTAKLEKALLRAYRREIARTEQRAARAMAGIIKILDAKR